jgi:hypothetical protein
MGRNDIQTSVRAEEHTPALLDGAAGACIRVILFAVPSAAALGSRPLAPR